MHTESQIQVSAVEWISLVLVIIGAINWGLVGIGGYLAAELNLVALLFGWLPALENLIYLVVGLAGLYLIFFGYQLYAAQGTPEERARAARQ